MRPRLLAAVLATGALLALPAAAQAASTTLVINEIDYDQVGLDTAEYLEIRNVSAAPINLGPYQLQLINGANLNVYSSTSLPAVELAAGDYFVVCGNNANVPNCDLDITPNDDLIQNGSPDAARIRLGTDPVDTVSYEGDTTGFTEGTGTSAADSNAVADISIARVPDGCDRDQNDTDFQVDAISPGAANTPGSGCPTDAAPTVASSDPADGESGVAPGDTITVTFSEPVTAGAGAFSLSCGGNPVAISASSSDQTTYTIDPAADLPRASCTLTVEADAVSDVDTSDPPDAMTADETVTFLVAGVEGLRIHDIQGAQHRSPFEGSTVSGVFGVVTAVSGLGFWMQDPQPDGDRRTSEGIFVFRGGSPAIGTAVTVSGLVEEFRPGDDPENLTTTEISSPTVTPVGTGTIPPTLLGKKGLRPPLRIIDNDSTGDVELNPIFDPWQDGIDFHESLEGMWVEISRPVAVGPTSSFDELPVVSDGFARPRSERGGVIIRPHDFNPERFILDDGLAEPPDSHVGDGFGTPVRAVVDYSFGNFKYLVTSSPTRIDNGLEREVTKRPDRKELSVGSMNVENLTFVDANDQKFTNLANILVHNMRAPDIVAIEEVQDNDGAANTPVTDATLTYERFIAKIATVGGPEYEFRQIDPVDDQDGGQPGGNIRVGFLFRTDRGLEFVDRPGGTPVNATEVVDGPSGARLTFSPGRLQHPTAFVASRKPLVGEFRWRGETVFAVANHFNSKGGDQPLFGRFQPPNRVTEPQRHEQATVVRDFVRQALDADRHARVIVMGDLNDFEFSETLEILEDAPLVNLMETLKRNARYSYVFEGNSQTLDQILVSKALRRRAEYDSVHVNAEFFDQASDHDPQVARLTVDHDHGHGHGRDHDSDSDSD
jgi:endonuclease/exonuclease/phosphatase family metal-dependent hydrolase